MGRDRERKREREWGGGGDMHASDVPTEESANGSSGWAEMLPPTFVATELCTDDEWRKDWDLQTTTSTFFNLPCLVIYCYFACLVRFCLGLCFNLNQHFIVTTGFIYSFCIAKMLQNVLIFDVRLGYKINKNLYFEICCIENKETYF